MFVSFSELSPPAWYFSFGGGPNFRAFLVTLKCILPLRISGFWYFHYLLKQQQQKSEHYFRMT